MASGILKFLIATLIVIFGFVPLGVIISKISPNWLIETRPYGSYALAALLVLLAIYGWKLGGKLASWADKSDEKSKARKL